MQHKIRTQLCAHTVFERERSSGCHAGAVPDSNTSSISCASAHQLLENVLGIIHRTSTGSTKLAYVPSMDSSCNNVARSVKVRECSALNLAPNEHLPLFSYMELDDPNM